MHTISRVAFLSNKHIFIEIAKKRKSLLSLRYRAAFFGPTGLEPLYPFLNEEMRYRIRLTEYELRVMINALNAVRLERDGEGKETSCLCDLLLRLLDVLEA